jgi:hypothetical protein
VHEQRRGGWVHPYSGGCHPSFVLKDDIEFTPV